MATRKKRPKPSLSGDLAALQGAWTFESVKAGGTEMPRDAIATASIAITGQRFVSEGMGAAYEGELVLDAAANPKWLDMLITKGHAAGTRHLGIYKLDDERWTMCLGQAGSDRPTRFSSTASNGFVLQALQRRVGDRGSRARAATTARRDAKTAATDTTSSVATAIEGEWAMVSGVFNGAAMAESMVKWCKRVTQSDVTSVLAGPRVMLRARFSLDTTKRPWTIDYVNLEGSDKGKTQRGIAELDGEALEICMSEPGELRPTAFASSKGDKRSYTTWRRR